LFGFFNSDYWTIFGLKHIDRLPPEEEKNKKKEPEKKQTESR